MNSENKEQYHSIKTHVLVLSHQGYSFLEKISGVIKELDWVGHCLSSRTAVNDEFNQESCLSKSRTYEVAKLFETSYFTLDSTLDWGSVKERIDWLRMEVEPEKIVVFSVWEGYRALAAKANDYCGTSDSSFHSVQSCQDKYLFRKLLKSVGLSSIDTNLIQNQESLEALKSTQKRFFVKPRRGAGSINARELCLSDSFEDLKNQQQLAKKDKILGELVSDDLVAEEYIDGIEFAAELFVSGGLVSIVSISEKFSVEELEGATVEPGCISPPDHVFCTMPSVEILQFRLTKILSILGLNAGIYHVELKAKSPEIIELIEINPRLGGAMIDELTACATGQSLIRLGLLALTQSHSEARKEHTLVRNALKRHYLESDKVHFFRVFFGKRNQKIKKIGWQNQIDARLSHLFAKQGEKLPDSAKEIFLAQALWSFDRNSNLQMKQFIERSQNALEVEYV